MTLREKAMRTLLKDFLDFRHAHVGFDPAVKDIPPRLRGAVPKGLEHSIWELVEHIRIAQHDILDFCRNPGYAHTMKWPDDYWPATRGPRSAAAWDKALASVRKDRRAMQQLAADPHVNLMAKIPHGTGQTYLREVLLAADHAAYHIAQIVDVRRALGNWGT